MQTMRRVAWMRESMSKDTEKHSIAGPGDRSAISRLRLLDFDDLFLLSHLLEGSTIAATAKQLGLTQPAITQRVRKIERVFGEPILQKAGRHVRLTKEGRAICVKAADALSLMREVAAEPSGQSLTIGTGPLAGPVWLWPTISEMHEQAPAQLYHCFIGAPEELTGMLDAGALDACLTTAPPTGVHSVLEICEEEYVMVARSDIAGGIGTIDDLARCLLVELDRSYSLVARIDRNARAQLRFRDVWFVGAVTNILTAVLAGQGVGILPHGMVKHALAVDKLRVVLPELDLEPDRYRLLYRSDRALDSLIEALAVRLKARKGP
jgi:DNA-binding transcriptional LysR family regulator